MSNDEDIDLSVEHSDDEAQQPTSQGGEGDPGEGFGVGGQIASIIYDVVESDGDDDKTKSPPTDPDEGFGTGGDIKAPKGH